MRRAAHRAPAVSPSRVRRAAGPLLLVLATIVLLGPLFSAPSLAAAAAPATSETPAPQPEPAPDDAPTSGPDLTAPPTTPPPPAPAPEPASAVITSPADGVLLDGATTVAGTAEPGSSVQIKLGGSAEPVCIDTADASGAFACDVSGLASSPATTVRVVALSTGAEPTEASVTVRVLTAPVVSGGPRGSLTNGVVLGSAYPGASVTAVAGAFECTATADASGAWTCPLGGGITDGEHLVSAAQSTSWSGGASAVSPAVAVQVDATVPSAPALQSPAGPGTLPATGAVFSGLGEDGARVSVFAGAHVLCETVVAGGSWSCQAGTVPAGSYNVAVLQQDAAGNVSVQSGALVMTFSGSVPSPGATPGAAPQPGPTATSPGSAAPVPGTEGGDASDAPGSGSGSEAGSGTGSGSGGRPGDGSTGPGAVAPMPDGWADGTPFSASLQPAFGSAAAPLWWVALVMAGAALLLLVLPARLLEKALRGPRGTAAAVAPDPGRPARSSAASALGRLTGRNRSREEFERAPDVRVSPWVSRAATLLASAAIVTLSGPVTGEPAYLRLYLAVVAAVVVVNVAATVLPAVIARAAFGIRSTPRLRPALLLVSVAFALVSRMAGIEPALVFGLVAALVLAAPAASARSERATLGRLATVQLLVLLLVGGAAWVAAGLITGLAGDGAPGFWVVAASELLHTIVLAALGSASLLLVPVARTSGRRILDWSPALWLLLAIVSFSSLTMLFVPSLAATAAAGGVLPLALVALGFAALCVSVWVWQRFVAAATDDD
ncbi:Ig-like domain-containing protein [Herbiconiux sp. CPCC 203407]|uniref:Ig-like domain-containing protein n=1 Tax=Herbiconiux oxytropis TaxID=2970915 RepID=A0AA41XJT4_9MICO|nr:Ig-like domain-containing protein [Herbiconiux oxytropis]MCS5724243.1 Ig-like domain-containing protein [Herbiconiux oxytropis]MCS5727555.1 Ig-like domain-containing protein [Herbiconiux oxytropis]